MAIQHGEQCVRHSADARLDGRVVRNPFGDVSRNGLLGISRDDGVRLE
jgi:hypothetical protein